VTNTAAEPHFVRVATNGIELHVAELGPADGPLVFLLHGFPEFWYGWRHQMGPLAEAGFRVIVPDQRGYNLSDKPREVSAYDLDRVVADVSGLADHYGRRSFTIVGHDWGALLGWWMATRYAGRLERFVALNAPHPSVWREAMRGNPAQKKKSWYVQIFRIPGLPEFLLRLRNFDAMVGGFRGAARPDAFTESDLARYREAWSQPGALSGGLNWYRALLKKTLPPAKECRSTVRTLVIWGVQDAYAVRELAEASARMCDDAKVVYLEQATHWVQHDEPERVNGLLLDFLRS